MTNVDVGVQVRQEPAELTRGDATEARWNLAIDVVDRDGQRDVRGRAVHGRRDERFIYLTWGEAGSDGAFEMFRRAKLMLDPIGADIVEAALDTAGLLARVDLTGDDGGPRCARCLKGLRRIRLAVRQARQLGQEPVAPPDMPHQIGNLPPWTARHSGTERNGADRSYSVTISPDRRKVLVRGHAGSVRPASPVVELLSRPARNW
ncbi:MAG: DUF5990 family protein [Acidimicrobiia bacterium]|nr:DUF5990 family protein [Acidimicrobiia bacterium]